MALETGLLTLTSIVHLESELFVFLYTGIDASGIVINCTQVQLRCVCYLLITFLPEYIFVWSTGQEHLLVFFFHNYCLSCKIKESRELDSSVLSPRSGAELRSLTHRDGCCRQHRIRLSPETRKGHCKQKPLQKKQIAQCKSSPVFNRWLFNAALGSVQIQFSFERKPTGTRYLSGPIQPACVGASSCTEIALVMKCNYSRDILTASEMFSPTRTGVEPKQARQNPAEGDTENNHS